ncbi:MAG: LssY C-terminal domain-containing protein [Ktedonobacteraceae bacterium]
MSYNDMSLACSRCGLTFVWTAYHQKWRASRGLMDVLTQCEKCRASGALERTANPAIVPAPPWDGLPMRTVTRKGVPGDPINLAFEGSQEALLAAFNTMGLLVADSLSLRSDLRIARAAVMHASYAAAPVSNLFLFDRPEDLAIEYELGSVARRHHARFWETGRRDEATQLDLWLGAVSTDIGIEVLHRHHLPAGTTHRIDPDLDAARDLLMIVLIEAGVVDAVVKRLGIGATSDGRNGGGDPFFTDGDVIIMVLKQVA